MLKAHYYQQVNKIIDGKYYTHLYTKYDWNGEITEGIMLIISNEPTTPFYINCKKLKNFRETKRTYKRSLITENDKKLWISKIKEEKKNNESIR